MEKVKFHWPDKTAVVKGAFEIVEKLRAKGFEAFIAGGAVRDALLKRPIGDMDIATSAKPDQVEKLFAKTIPTGKKHGTITVRLNKMNFEVTTFRAEGQYLDYRRPGRVKFIKNPESDAQRRDFTINALFYDAEKRQVIDYVGGLADLSSRKIKLVGKSENRIKEDALRMMRAVRLVMALDFELDRDTRKAISHNAKLITKISAERIKQELDKIMMSKRASIGLGLLDVVSLLEHVLPELKSLQGVTQPKNQHAEGDVYAHSLLALELVDDSYDLATRYAVLFHDLGKVQTRQIRNNKITFYDHPNVGAGLAVKILKRLKTSSQDTEKIAWLVRAHMVPNDFVNMKLSTRRKWGLSPNFADLLRVYKADASASYSPKGQGDTNPRGFREGLKILNEITDKPQLRQPLISGNDVMKILEIKSGPLVGRVLKFVDEKKLGNKLKTKIDAIKFLKQNKKFLKNL